MDNKIGSIDNDGNMTNSNMDDFNNMVAPSDNEMTSSYDTSSYNSGFNTKEDNTNEEFDVFGNSKPQKEGINKKILIVPIAIVFIIIIALIIVISSGNKYKVITSNVTIKIDETAEIKVEGKQKVLDQLTYQTEDKKIATVDKDGQIKGVSVGKTTIYVGKKGKKEHKITVKVNTNKEALILQVDKITVNKDETFQLKVKNVLKDDVFTYSSNNENVATIDQEGLITGVHAGKTTIIVKESDGRTVKATVEVKSDEVLIESISLNPATIAIGETLTLKPVYTPANALAIFKYSTSNEKIVEVDENGVVTGIKAGTATISVESHNGVKVNTKITVDEKLANKISISGCKNVVIGTPVTLTVDYEPDTATNKVTWTSSNETIATVSGGKITGKTPGKAVITATTPNGKTAVCSITVSPTAVSSLKASVSSVTLDQNATKKVSVTFDPSSSSKYYTVTWKSSNAKIAKVDGEGNITGLTPGTATITASAGGKSAKITVTVNASEVTSIALTGCQTSLEAGDTFTMTAKAAPATAKNATIRWKTSNSTVASVSGGKVTAKAAGSATITAYTENGTQAVCNVTVAAPKINKSDMKITIDGTEIQSGGTYKITAGKNKTIYLKTNLSSSEMTKYYKVTWTSSNTATATVTAASNTLSSTLKAIKAGVTTVYATVGGETISFSVTVENPAITSFTATSDVSVSKGSTKTITASTNLGSTEFNKYYKATWKSSNTSIATVTVDSSNSLKITIKGVKAGEATITGSVAGKTVKIKVKVS